VAKGTSLPVHNFCILFGLRKGKLARIGFLNQNPTQQLSLEVMKRFEAEGIEFALPTKRYVRRNRRD
jgi:hypothetical protein